MFYYESLAVYQKAFTINKEIYQFLKHNKAIPSYMKNQLGRASLSVMLNIAEGTAKTGIKDRRNFWVIARGSAFESASLIKFLVSQKEIPTETADAIHNTLEEISKMLYAMIKKSEERTHNTKVVNSLFGFCVPCFVFLFSYLCCTRNASPSIKKPYYLISYTPHTLSILYLCIIYTLKCSWS